MIDENYETSENLLKEICNNKQLIVSSHTSNQLNLPQLISSDYINDFRKIYDRLKLKFVVQKILNIQSEICGSLLNQVLLSKLSSELSLIINRQFDKKKTVEMFYLF